MKGQVGMDSRRIKIECGGVVAEAALLGDAAPKTVESLWNVLPIRDRTIQVRWSGNAWRTEGNYRLLPEEAPVENVAGRLSAGDIIYYPDYSIDLIKVGIAYGDAQWLAPFCQPVDVALIGKIDVNLDAFVTRCEKLIFEEPMTVMISRL
jgi:hypothetical protein